MNRRAALLLATAAVSSVVLAGPSVGAGTMVRPSSLRCIAAPDGLVRLGTSRQLITVEVPDEQATTASLALWQRSKGTAGASCFTRIAGPYPANIGENGTSTSHREGDGTTPVGLFRLGPELYGIAANPGVHYPYHRLVCGDWWDEDPTSALYNRFVHVPCPSQPTFAAQSEALWRIAPFYDWMAVIEYNSAPIVPGKGSGIFLHVTVGTPTVGCVAIPAPDLLRALRWLEPTDKPLIAIGTAAELTTL